MLQDKKRTFILCAVTYHSQMFEASHDINSHDITIIACFWVSSLTHAPPYGPQYLSTEGNVVKATHTTPQKVDDLEFTFTDAADGSCSMHVSGDRQCFDIVENDFCYHAKIFFPKLRVRNSKYQD